MALKSELGEQGFSLFDEWSRQSDKYNARDVRDTWRSIQPDGGITLATLYFRAKSIGWRYNGERPTREEIERGRRETAERAKREKDRKAREHAKAAKRAVEIWGQSIPALDHPYLTKKGVAPVETLRQIESASLGYVPVSSGGKPLDPCCYRCCSRGFTTRVSN
jgi:putative DNA primase/helicase